MTSHNFIYDIGLGFLGVLGVALLTGIAIILVLAWREIMQESYQQLRNTYYFAVYIRMMRRMKKKRAKKDLAFY